MRWTSSRARGVLVAAVLSVGGCGGERTPVEPLPLEKIEDVTFHESLEVNLEEMEVTENGVYWRDVELGEGAVAEPGAQVTLTYVVRLRNGQRIDSSDDSGPYTFVVDGEDDGSIEGFHDGVRGMLLNGRRKFIVPPEMAYNQGGPAGILIFDVKLISVTEP